MGDGMGGWAPWDGGGAVDCAPCAYGGGEGHDCRTNSREVAQDIVLLQLAAVPEIILCKLASL